MIWICWCRNFCYLWGKKCALGTLTYICACQLCYRGKNSYVTWSKMYCCSKESCCQRKCSFQKNPPAHLPTSHIHLFA